MKFGMIGYLLLLFVTLLPMALLNAPSWTFVPTGIILALLTGIVDHLIIILEATNKRPHD